MYHRRRPADASTDSLDAYLAALEQCLAGQIDPALEANGIITPLGAVARAAIVEAIGADLEAAVRDLMLSGVPRAAAEAQVLAELGPAPSLGRDLLAARRRKAVEAWEHGRESVWWWTEPLLPVAGSVLAVFMAAVTPTLAIIAGMTAEPHLGTMAVAIVPLVVGLCLWVAGALAPHFGEPDPRR
ncbi:MAG: hypothetical protein HY332_16225 [Chloroflexi bacterium]|nr:hypothetical protein [Chloroflexota bacterium]